MKRTFSALLTVATIMSTNALAASCGTNCEYQVEGNVLSIWGTGTDDSGRMGWNSNKGGPWNGSNVTEVVIAEGITNIGPNMFMYNQKNNYSSGLTAYFPNLQNVTLPSTLTRIEEGAFYLHDPYYNHTFTFNDVDLSNVIYVGRNAFNGTQIKNLTLPTGDVAINDLSFSNTKVENIKGSVENLTMFLEAGGILEPGSDGKINVTCTSGDCETYLRENSKYANNSEVLAAMNFINLNGNTSNEDENVGNNSEISNADLNEPSETISEGNNDGNQVLNEPVQPTRKIRRIYTVEEAAAVSKDTGNTFKLRYK